MTADPSLTELAELRTFLDRQRRALLRKAEGLDDTQFRIPLAPSPLTLGRLLAHASFCEDYWFRVRMAAGEPSAPWDSGDWDSDPDWEMTYADTRSAADLRTLFEEAVRRSNEVCDELAASGIVDLTRTDTSTRGKHRVSRRWILLHMIEETARHAGHADLIREAIDGQTGV